MVVKRSDDEESLFETTKSRGSFLHRVFSMSLFVAICFVYAYRLTHIPTGGEDHGGGEDYYYGTWTWLGLLAAELWFGLYWVLTQAVRWNLVFRKTFKKRLAQRYEESKLPEVDIFVCTADPEVEPPIMVINTVLSHMAYDYPSEKLSVYLSDDAASDLTFYALLEASLFAKHWLPFCKKFNVQPTSPAAYFNNILLHHNHATKEFANIKKLYDEMKKRIEDATKLGRVASEERSKHRGFSQWDSYSSRRDHDTILQIILHKKEPHNSKDEDGNYLPTLVYLAREKRPQHHHNFKAGAMNSLLRVSSVISNAKIILNVDCDMYSNSSESVRDALCFLMDEEKGHEIAFVQFPQTFENILKHDIYSSTLLSIVDVEMHGADHYGGPFYIGTCCFHRRDALSGMKFSVGYKNELLKSERDNSIEENLHELEVKSKALASCNYEKNTLWGKEMGVRYGCLVEDVMTGLCIHLQGWKSVYYSPPRKAFYGVAPTTLLQALVQHKRWAEGQVQILLSEHCPALYGHGRISLGHQLGYSYCNCWALTSLSKLYYSIIPSLYLLRGIPLFPKMSSIWFIPFAYVIVGESARSLLEFVLFGSTIQGWWNDLRMVLYKGTSSYLFALIDSISKLFGLPDSPFTVTAKVMEEDVSERYEKQVMEFGAASPLFTVLATIALLNLFCLLGILKELALCEDWFETYKKMSLQILLCGFLVLINIPIYQGLFLRKDKGRLPSSIAIKSTVLALSTCILFNMLKD
ncbi:cellulose synthase-like protein E1 isoform X4 [Arachis duranensis]|uniref:Cellulose synthase-like protein E1 isoform X4 n=1 Tax=Arachis duranensis TaxID=130453 RepID=A0A6P4DVD7_ARADU|nr:cellulose synthase-like protein E1 isoform X4 [Arachis duranensis]